MEEREPRTARKAAGRHPDGEGDQREDGNIFIYALRYADGSELDEFLRWLEGKRIITEGRGMANDRFITVTEKDWEKASPEQRDWMVLNTLKSMDERLRTLEKWLFLKTLCLFAGSVVGGAIMILILVTFKVKVF